MLIDTHAHLNFAAYKNDFDNVINKSLENNTWMINVGTNYQTSKMAVEIANKEGVFASVGLHPINLDTRLLKIRIDESETGKEFRFETSFDHDKYLELIAKGKEKIVAVGEIGFDYWYRPKGKGKREQFKEKQKELFRKEVALAEEFKLPLILHCRLGYEDLIQELKNINYKYGGVVHCFCGKLEEAQEFIKIGYHIGFNGIIFKLKLDEIIKKIPIEKILVETDCPFLTPPELSEERNEPINVKYVVERIAKDKKLKSEEVEKITTENAIKLFRLK